MQHNFSFLKKWLSRPELLSFWGTGFTLHPYLVYLLNISNKNNHIYSYITAEITSAFFNLSIRLRALLLALWSTACHYSNPSIFKYGQHICRTKRHCRKVMSPWTRFRETKDRAGQTVHAWTQQHEHTWIGCQRREPSFLSLRWQSNVRTQSKEHMATVLKVEWALKDKKAMKG